MWRIKDNLQKHFLCCHHWSDEKWKKSMARGGGNKKRYQYSSDSSGAILYLRALQAHSGRNLIDHTLQDNVIIPDGFFNYIHHVGCAINLHSIINSGLIPGGQNLSKSQTVFFTAAELINKEHRDPKPRFAWHKQKKWKKHQKHGILGRHQCCSEERVEVLSNTIEHHHSSRSTPSLLYPESCSDGNWRGRFRKSI